MWGLFIHFVGDVFTSMLVLGCGALYHFLDTDAPNVHWWIIYADSVASLISCIVVLTVSYSLVKSTGWVLLQAGELAALRGQVRGIYFCVHTETFTPAALAHTRRHRLRTSTWKASGIASWTCPACTASTSYTCGS